MIILQENIVAAYDHYLTVDLFINRAINRVLKKGSVTRNRKTIKLTPRLRNFLSSLRHNAGLETLITLPPSHYKKHFETIGKTQPRFLSKTNNAEKEILANIFVDHGYKKIDKFKFVSERDIDCCPYCNRNYIYSLEKKMKQKVVRVKPQIDHFYPQTKYPWLAASFYNLIPCCQTCNGIDGGKNNESPRDHKLKNPYLVKDGDFKFSYTIKTINVLNPLKDKMSIKVRLKAPKGNNELFGLKKFYELHSDHVLELIIKSQLKYSKRYRAYLHKQTQFRFSDSEIDRMILGNYALIEETHRRPLAKLYQDVGRELGLL